MRLQGLTYEVKHLLETFPETRENDNRLYVKMLENRGLANEAVGNILYNLDFFNLPTIESVGRIRRKVQEENPSLKPSKASMERKAELQQEFYEFAKGL